LTPTQASESALPIIFLQDIVKPLPVSAIENYITPCDRGKQTFSPVQRSDRYPKCFAATWMGAVMVRTRKNPSESQISHNDLAEKLEKLEKHLTQLEDQLVRAQRLAALGTMANMIAHEFNNILTPVVSYAQFALKQDDVPLMKKALTKAYENGKEAAEVCQQLLSFGRGDHLSKTCDVEQVIAATIKCLVRNPAKDNITLQLDLIPGLNVSIEPCMLQQVVYNLILNARDAMLGKQGRLKISTSSSDDNKIKIIVSDSGPGIDPSILSKIFDPFFTTKSKSDETRGGSGLGLAVSKHILQRAGGSISVESELGKGTTFTIELPRIMSA
jgi:two-component system NtrC family sensor kinase